MKLPRITELEVELIINKRLYEKKIIDYKMYQLVNNFILNKINRYK